MTTTKSTDDLIDALSYAVYREIPRTPQEKLIVLLDKLGVKSATRVRAKRFPGPIQVESLEATLKSVTFDMKDLQMWPNIKPK